MDVEPVLRFAGRLLRDSVDFDCRGDALDEVRLDARLEDRFEFVVDPRAEALVDDLRRGAGAGAGDDDVVKLNSSSILGFMVLLEIATVSMPVSEWHDFPQILSSRPYFLRSDDASTTVAHSMFSVQQFHKPVLHRHFPHPLQRELAEYQRINAPPNPEPINGPSNQGVHKPSTNHHTDCIDRQRTTTTTIASNHIKLTTPTTPTVSATPTTPNTTEHHRTSNH